MSDGHLSRQQLDSLLDRDFIPVWERHVEACDKCQRNLDARRKERIPSGGSTDSSRKGHQSSDTIELKTSLVRERVLKTKSNGEVCEYKDESARRTTVVKLLKVDGETNADDASRLRRDFARECLITATLEHPGVPPVYSVGTSSLGDSSPGTDLLATPSVYAMRNIQGNRFDELIKKFHQDNQHTLSRGDTDFQDLIGNLKTICSTIQHAHERDIVHCDLKPQNIKAQKDVAIVLDWGIARFDKSGCGENGREGHETPPESLSFTRAYMAPELARRLVGREERTLDYKKLDIYHLGSILFTILTDEPPHQQSEQETDEEFYKRIAGQPSPDALERLRRTRPHALERLRGTTPHGRRIKWNWRREMDSLGELNSICKQAMNHNPSDRYLSPEEMGEELETWLVGIDKVKAHPYSARENLVRLGRKHVAVLGYFLVLAFATAVFSVAYADRNARAYAIEKELHAIADGEKLIAQEQTRQAVIARNQAEIAKKQADDARKQAEIAKKEADERSSRIEAFSMDATLRAIKAGDLAAFDKADRPPLSDTWEARYLMRLASIKAQRLSTLTTATWGILDAALHRDERRLLAAEAGGRLTLWDRSTRKVQRQWGTERIYPAYKLPLHHFHARDPMESMEKWGRCVCAVEWVGDSDQFVAASTDGRGILGDATSGEERPLLEVSRSLLALGINTAGTAALFGSADGHVYLRGTKEGPAKDRKISDAPISQIVWHDEAQQWIVGDESGLVQVLKSEDLSEVATLHFDQPIWSLDIGVSDQGTLLAVAGEDRGIRLLKWMPDQQWKDYAVLDASATGKTSKVQQLKFAAGARELFAWSQDGVLALWRLADRSVPWTVTASRADDRRVQFFQELSKLQPPVPIPLAFRRAGSAILTLVDQRRIITAGDDARICLWDLPSSQLGLNRVSERTGPQPQIAFDTTADPNLWALDQSGELSVMEPATGRVISRLRAHAGQRAGIAALPNDQGIATVGGDTMVKFWRLNGREIVPTGKELRHDQPLISIAVSTDGALIATMDVRAQLCVWRLETGETLFKDSLGSEKDEAPWTGKVAFNSDTTSLAAFGPGQSGFVYIIRKSPWNFRRRPDQLMVAGQGGSALLWNPALPQAVLLADDHPRLHSGAFDGPEAGVEFHFDAPESTCVALRPSPDGERIISLEASGRIVFHASRWQHKMFELRGSIHQGDDRRAVDLAVDRRERWLAVANQQGEVEFWDGGTKVKADSGLRLDEAARKWKMTEILDRSPAVQRIAERTLQLDSQDRLCFLFTNSLRGDIRNDGLLQFVREERGQMLREPLTPGNPEFTRRMDYTAAGLSLTADDEPVVALRCRTATKTPYDGIFYAAQRTSSGKWLYETIHDSGNLGFGPVLLLATDTTPNDVIHFSYGGFNLIHSHRQANESWSAEVIGQQGDGMHLQSRLDRDGRVHLLYKINRFNGDPIPMAYMVWDPQDGEKTREVMNGIEVAGGTLELAPDSTPMVVDRRFDADRRVFQQWLLRRTDEGWRDFQRLPIQDPTAWKIGPDGATYLLEWNKSRQELFLLRGTGDKWQRRTVDTLGANNGISSAILFDRAGLPVVYVASSPEPYGWAKIYRVEP